MELQFKVNGTEQNKCRHISTNLNTKYTMMIVISFLVAAFTTGIIMFLTDTSHAAIKVAAFNIQAFGVSKMSHYSVASKIVKIIQRYDIVLIQEVRDSGGSALQSLEKLLDAGDSWSYTSSVPLGRTRYKEKYVFFYRNKFVKLLDHFQYDDSAYDYYEREPFAVEIQYYSSCKSAMRKVALLGLHTRPEYTPAELEHLPNVMRAVSHHFSNADGVIAMGDFNADCSYLNTNLRTSLEIFKTNSVFTSYISDSVDTTVSHNTNCAYDRIISLGNVIVRNAKVYNFQSSLGLSDIAAKDVSDHYPVEFTLH